MASLCEDGGEEGEEDGEEEGGSTEGGKAVLVRLGVANPEPSTLNPKP